MPGKSADSRFKIDPKALSEWKEKMQGVFNIVGVVKEAHLNDILPRVKNEWWSGIRRESYTSRLYASRSFLDYMEMHKDAKDRYEEEAYYWWWDSHGHVIKKSIL